MKDKKANAETLFNSLDPEGRAMLFRDILQDERERAQRRGRIIIGLSAVLFAAICALVVVCVKSTDRIANACLQEQAAVIQVINAKINEHPEPKL